MAVRLTSPGENLISVVLPALLVSDSANSEDGGSRDSVGGKSSLRLGLARVRLPSEEVADLVKELLRGSVL